MTAEVDIEQLLAADDARYRFTIDADVDALGSMLTDDFTYTHNAGFTDDKAAYLGRIAGGGVRYSDGRRIASDVRIHGNAGIMTGHMQMIANLPSEAVQLDNLFLALWLREGGIWRLAAWSSTTRQSEG